MKKIYKFSTSELVTEVRVQLTRRPPILAYIDVTLWGTFVIHDLRILERHDGSRVLLMPRVQNPDGSWSTIAHPIQESARAKIEKAVLTCFEHLAAAREAKPARPLPANAIA